MKSALLLGAALPALALAHAAVRGPSAPAATHVAVRAGTIHVVPGREVLRGGATLLVRDGRVVAAGANLAIPPDAQVIDYGPDAVIVPGLVAADSLYALNQPADRTASPGLRAIDNFDPDSRIFPGDLAGGVTSAYIAPARGRLIAGQGAVVKLAGPDPERRVLLASAALQGSIGVSARSVPGYWEPPIPASFDVGLGRVQKQLPGSLMGAVAALRELLAFGRGQSDLGNVYGTDTGRELQALLRAGVPLRIEADSENEIRALLELAQSEKLSLVIDGGQEADRLADAIARAGARVVLTVDAIPEEPGRFLGREEDARWPRYDQAATLVNAGVKLAIATPDSMRTRDLLFAAALASRGGLSQDEALRAVTLGAAEVLGVADRVGSLEPGKDADFAVLTGEPLAGSSGVIATWVEGTLAWNASASSHGDGARPRAVVIEADVVHVGDGTVIAPGQVLLRDGRVAEVGRRVSQPRGATVVRGPVAMPGMIDALGHLGLEGASKTPATDFKLKRILEPADHVDRRVALAGVTTVVLSPRGDGKTGVPMMAYKPSGPDAAARVVADPVALRLTWTDARNRIESGKNVRELLEKAKAYADKWREYEQAIANWKPETEPAATAEEAKPAEAEGEAKDEGENGKSDAGSKKNKKDDAPEVDPFAGIWEADVVVPPAAEPTHLRLRMEREGGELVGSLRCAAVSETLIQLAGEFEGGEVRLRGSGSRGRIEVFGKPSKGALKGTLRLGEVEVAFEAARTSVELPRAGRSERRREKKEEVKEPKGKPKQPGLDEKLEPLRRAMHGKGAVVVAVDRREEIRACVAAFEAHGIAPVLLGADDAWRMADELRGRVAGVLLTQTVFDGVPRGGLAGQRNRWSELASAGIPLGFHSGAEEGAAELPLTAAFAVYHGLGADAALRALCADVAAMYSMSDRVGRLAVGLDGDVLLLDGPPLDPRTRVLRAWVGGEEVH
ncbi:MAG TPA: amidohydrolase family protein [Planctomycetota bacterium]|nr:amidohydrolase family protein [Planctomycetota bacterium]